MKKLLLAEDHAIVIKGISILIETEFEEYTVDVVKNTTDLVKALRAYPYSTAIIDLQLEDGDTTHLIRDLVSLFPNLNIMIFSANPEEIFAQRMYQEGVKGYLNKQSSDSEVIYALKLIFAGKIYMSETFKKVLLNKEKEEYLENPFEKLSQRELEVSNLLLQGKKSGDICNELNLQPSTVATYKMKIMQKLKVNNLLELRQLAANYR